MAKVKFYSGENIPLEMHKVRIVQKLNLPPIEQRLNAIIEAGLAPKKWTRSYAAVSWLTS